MRPSRTSAPEVSRRAALFALGALATGCARPGEILLRGAGATLPTHLYESWVAAYGSLRPRLRIDYLSIGSGGGLRQLADHTVDFGASDVEPDDVERAAIADEVLVLPVATSALAVAVCLPEGAGAPTLVLDFASLARIFTGEISRWDDPAIARLNPRRQLPKRDLVPIARSDGGGSTAIFTRRLAARSPELARSVGVGRSVTFPTAVGARGSDGVAATVAATPGSIGYVEVTHAVRAGLEIVALAEGDGEATLPTVEAVGRAITSGEGYPLASHTYLVALTRPRDAITGAALAHFVRWVLGPGQALLAPGEPTAIASGFLPLPAASAARGRAAVAAMTFDGRPLLVID